jgi:ABC-type dipeptide/oligopeptide/nickel transport system ATPase component
MDQATPILEIQGLRIAFGTVKAVDGVSITVGAGELVGIVGESGSGKSTLARSILDLVPGKRTDISFDRLTVGGKQLHRRDLAQLRGATFAMIFQDPLSYLNPLMTIGKQIEEAAKRYERSSDVKARVLQLLELVRLPAARYGSYPHELSGGMRQRVLIAIALACRPKMLIADEPTTALDVTTQAEILDLLKELSLELGMALLLISHDLGVIATLCQRLYIMRHGKVVERPARWARSSPNPSTPTRWPCSMPTVPSRTPMAGS